jgi:hypothetical protein
MSPSGGLDTKTDRLTDRQLQHDFDFDFDSDHQFSAISIQLSVIPVTYKTATTAAASRHTWS